eukprot:TRINITY_DN60_c2_g1_i1.p1 TRINITY_DN60_c2_g1~~TRINITY_DN60_c2_g1_i1.p1  ORF type:complete len:278 (+),score=72.88 TRINITY_DN60_c2_g1_i1:99-836(+)
MVDDFDLDMEDVKKGGCFDNIVNSTNQNFNTAEETTAKKAAEEEVRKLRALKEAQDIEAENVGIDQEKLRQQQERDAQREIHNMLLSSSYYNLTQPSDSVRPNYVTPPKSNAKSAPPYYPQKVLPCLSSPELFEKFDQDTLFFIFYYQQETYQQYLAARQLKGASWRYHKKEKCWFIRSNTPKETKDDYEVGTYVFFDFQEEWKTKRKENYKFEYNHLEEELPSALVKPKPKPTEGQSEVKPADS